MMYAYPRVILEKRCMNVRIHKSGVPFRSEKEYFAVHTNCENFIDSADNSEIDVINSVPIFHSDNAPSIVEAEVRDGELYMQVCLLGEQEHIFRVFEGEQEIGTVNLYSIHKDLCGLYPYKGDFHLHSIYSDGKQPPAEIACECRKVGFDFMALTDHGKYAPSVELKKFFEPFSWGLEIYEGEEIHLPEHHVHMLNIGGRESVTEMAYEDEQRYRNEIGDIEQELEVSGEAIDPYMPAAAIWAMRKTKETGGMSVLCHPYWRRKSGYNNSTAVTDILLERQDFDALEVISGYGRQETDQNTLQVAKYHELRARGKQPAIIGTSDAHSVRERSDFPWDLQFGWFYTIVFAGSNKFDDVRRSILEHNSVAAEKLGDAELRIYGVYRLVKYALFLAREFFPEHDKVAAQEADLMEAYWENGGKGHSGNVFVKMRRLYDDVFSIE